MDQQVKSPPHQRLGEFSVKHLIGILKHLKGGSIGFDPARDDRTATKSAFVDFLRGNWTPAQIDEAHKAVVKMYGGGEWHGNGHYRNRQRVDDQNVEIQGVKNVGGNGNGQGEGQGNGQADGQANGQGQGQAQGQSEGNGQGEGQGQKEGQGDQSEGQDGKGKKAKGKRGKSEGDDQSEGQKGNKADETLEQIAKLINEAVNKGKAEQKRQQNNEGKSLQHKNFDLLLTACKATDADGHHLNVWLYGPAGTGKTTAARNVSKVLGLPFFFNSALDTGYKLTGFVDANGRIVRTPFREAWENGGVYLFDEVDGSAPSALIEFNAALANGAHSFPDKIVPRHPDCIIIAGANTAGLGGTSEYVGRAKQDAAFLDRFVLLDWPIDEALELAICPNKDWCKRVQAVRKTVQARGLKGVLVSPRASLYGASLLAAGMPQNIVERMTLQKSMTPDQWKQVSEQKA
jgi:cobaltochelatase CobS